MKTTTKKVIIVMGLCFAFFSIGRYTADGNDLSSKRIAVATLLDRGEVLIQRMEKITNLRKERAAFEAEKYKILMEAYHAMIRQVKTWPEVRIYRGLEVLNNSEISHCGIIMETPLRINGSNNTLNLQIYSIGDPKMVGATLEVGPGQVIIGNRPNDSDGYITGKNNFFGILSGDRRPALSRSKRLRDEIIDQNPEPIW